MPALLPWRLKEWVAQKRRSRAFGRAISKRSWTRFNAIHEEAAHEAISRNPDSFDKDFLKDAASRRFELEKASFKLIALSLPILILLASRSFGSFDLNLFGLSFKGSPAVREFLLCVLAGMGATSAYISIQADTLGHVLFAASKARMVEERHRYYYESRWRDVLGFKFQVPTTSDKFPAQSTMIWAITLAASMFLTGAIYISFSLIVTFSTLVDIVLNPLPQYIFSYAAALFVLSADVLALCLLYFRIGPVRYTDVSVANDLNRLYAIDRDAWERRLDELGFGPASWGSIAKPRFQIRGSFGSHRWTS